jgi:hypothetical protein
MIRKFLLGAASTLAIVLVIIFGLIGFVDSVFKLDGSLGTLIFVAIFYGFLHLTGWLANKKHLFFLRRASDEAWKTLPQLTRNRTIIVCGVIFFWGGLIISSYYFLGYTKVYEVALTILSVLLIVSINFLENEWREADKHLTSSS